MSALICGSLAYDTVMVFEGRFRDHILADRIHMLNVSFLVPSMRRNFGGCAGNIAYNLKLLGGEGLIMATAGHDFAPYEAWLTERGIALDHVRTLPEEFTAQAFITTDLDDNQITAFHPGAMNHAHLNQVGAASGVKLGVISPDGRQGMLEHARQFAAAGIPYLFDPGQGLPMFDGAELRRFVEQASWVAVNDYEAEMLAERTGMTLDAMSRSHLRGIVVTLGADGCELWQKGERLRVPGVTAASVLDPTGCGDAFRAALLYGLERGWSLERCAGLGNRLGALKIASRGGQNHVLDRTIVAT